MIGYLLRRTLALVVILLVVSAFVFVALHVVPGDPAQIIVGPNAPPAQVQQVRHALELDRPLFARYLSWIKGIVHGRFGTSITYSVPVAQLIGSRLKVTLPLTSLAMLIATLLALPLGVYSATKRNRLPDWSVQVFVQVGLSTPSFWLGLLLIALFAVNLRWLPSGGFVPWVDSPLEALKSLLLPALALGVIRGAALTRLVRSAVLDTLNEQYIDVARAKGVTEIQLIKKHVLKNSFISILTIIGLQVGKLIAGAIIIEEVFSLPGIGRLVLNSVWQRDFPVIQASVVIISGLIVFTNFVVDSLYGVIDPRIRYG